MIHMFSFVIQQPSLKKKKKSELPWGRRKTFLKTLSKSHNFVTFIVFFFFFFLSRWKCERARSQCFLYSLEQKILIIASW